MISTIIDIEVIFLIGGICILTAIIILAVRVYIRSIRIRQQVKKNKIFADIIHELLTPLTILSASVEHLRLRQPEEQKEYDLMQLNIQRSIRLLQQIMETSHEEEQDTKLHVSNGDVMRRIIETARCTEPLMSSKKLSFTIRCKPESMMGWIDIDKLDKIVFNLLSNAAWHTPEQGKVSLDVNTNANYDRIIIRVSDTGKGISKELIRHMQSPYTNDNYWRKQVFSSKRSLSIVHDYVYQHNGTIKCKSIEGQGTTFLLEMPINKESFRADQIDESRIMDPSTADGQVLDVSPDIVNSLPEPEQPETEDRNAHTILVVEGNDELKALMQVMLRPKYNVHTVSNAQEALDTIREKSFDLIVCDSRLEDMDGYELTTRIKQDTDYSHLPVVLLTNNMPEENSQKALEAGADNHVAKPFRLGELQLIMDNLIANRQRILQALPQVAEDESVSAYPSELQEFMERAVRCVNEHLDDGDYDRDAFAADMGASASTLYNKLRAATGMNVTTFIRDIRIKAACRMAKEKPDLRVSDIAYRVGFKDPKYFATTFKKVLGVQPKEYFDKMRNER